MAISRHVGAWQWKAAWTSLPAPLYDPVMVCTQLRPSGWRAHPGMPSAHLGTSYSTGEAIPHVTRRTIW